MDILNTAKGVYKGILGGLAKQLPIQLPGVSPGRLPSTTPELQYLGGPQVNPNFCVTINAPAGDNGRGAVQVVASLDGAQQLSLSAGSRYDAPFDQGLAELVGGETAGTIARLFGIRTVTKSMTSQVWQGSEHLCLTINLLFIAEEDAMTEVIQPIKSLMSLAMPSVDTDKFLSAPGPRVRFKTPEEGGVTLDSFTGLFKNVLSAGAGALGLGGPTQDSNGNQIAIPSFKQSLEEFTGLFDQIGVDNPTSIGIGQFMMFKSVVVKNVEPVYEQVFDPNGLPMVARVAITFETHQIPTVQDLDDVFPGSGSASAEGLSSLTGSLTGNQNPFDNSIGGFASGIFNGGGGNFGGG